MNNFHKSVLLDEVLELLQVKSKEKYIDATLGGGGHALGILKSGGIVLGIDQDKEALEHVALKLKDKIETRDLTLAKGNFRDIDKIAHLNNFGKVKGILYDLGVSSHQIDEPKRGFSFLKDGPLDMRMDSESPVTAEVLVNLLKKEDLIKIFSEFGQERRSFAIANAIVKKRKEKAIKTTGGLSKIIESVYGFRGEVSNFNKNEINKRVFQALRIAVNNELENLNESLIKAVGLLQSGGRLAVISFHSLEDISTKKVFENLERENMGKIITLKPIEATEEEKSENSRSRSAKLRVFEKN